MDWRRPERPCPSPAPSVGVGRLPLARAVGAELGHEADASDRRVRRVLPDVARGVPVRVGDPGRVAMRVGLDVRGVADGPGDLGELAGVGPRRRRRS